MSETFVSDCYRCGHMKETFFSHTETFKEKDGKSTITDRRICKSCKKEVAHAMMPTILQLQPGALRLHVIQHLKS
jgi:nitrate/TMAO reductase-like tetraheme cytochrome c subunit